LQLSIPPCFFLWLPSTSSLLFLCQWVSEVLAGKHQLMSGNFQIVARVGWVCVVWPLLWPQSGNSAQNAAANTTFNFCCFRIVSQQGLPPHHKTVIQRKSSTINNITIAINIDSFTSITRRTLRRNIYLFPYNIQIITQAQHNTFKYVKIFWEWRKEQHPTAFMRNGRSINQKTLSQFIFHTIIF
jgi:hypothetical protein